MQLQRRNSLSVRVDNKVKEPSINLENNAKLHKNLDQKRKLEKTNLKDNKNKGKKIQIEGKRDHRKRGQ